MSVKLSLYERRWEFGKITVLMDENPQNFHAKQRLQKAHPRWVPVCDEVSWATNIERTMYNVMNMYRGLECNEYVHRVGYIL